MRNNKLRGIWFVILIIAITFIIIGITRGEQSALFAKAINICLECIGIG